MLTYYPVPSCAEGLCGLAYALRSGEEGMTLRLPALTAQVQVTLSGSARHLGVHADARIDPAIALLGPTSAAADAVMAPNTTIVGLGLLPTGWARVVRASAAEVADRIVPGDAIWGRASSEALLGDMRAALDLASAADLLFRFVSSRQREPRTDSDARIALTMQWLARAGAVDVGALAQALDLSLRQTERFTARTFGTGPKLLELKYRVLRLAAVSALSDTRVYDVEHGGLLDSFYDQSHLIRNFQRFVGHAPVAFDGQADFARTMLRGRWQGGARDPMTLWS